MNLSIRWLKQYLHTDLSIDELIDTITMAGHEVEEIFDLGMVSGKIVVARVLDVQAHPDADKLSVCTVDAGQGGEPLNIVCGAPNVQAGKLYPCALVGADLGEGFVIKKAKIRGQASEGMLCSARELGLGSEHAGIMELPEDWTVGEPFDTVLEIKVTPNRPDCLSVVGIARDIAAMLDKHVYPPKPRVKEAIEPVDHAVDLSVTAREACPRYTCRLVRGVKIAPSPLWMQRALQAAGLRPINNVVDVTNYVLLELGHPLHAFDFNTLAGGKIIVRMAEAGEKITLIDETVLELTREDLVIADGERPVALAGVMGGADTEVTEQTQDVLLESAYFDPSTIRRTAKRYNLQTDSSYRFERGTDRKRLTLALDRAAELIQQLAGGELLKGCRDVQGPAAEVEPIVLSVDRVNSLLGIELSSTQIADYLTNLDFEIRPSDRTTLMVSPPSHRVDVTRDVDLIEEVARLYSYNKIPSTLPKIISSAHVESSLETVLEDVGHAMVALGFTEAMSYSFIGDERARELGFDPATQPRVANPLTVDQTIMRPTILPGLLTAVDYNQKQGEPSIALFEIGKVWNPGARAGQLDGEHFELAAVLTGPLPGHWAQPERNADFYDLKGVVESLLTHLAPASLRVEPLADSSIFHPGRAATIEWMGSTIGEMGELHPDHAVSYDLKGRVYALLLDLNKVAEWAAGKPRQFKAIPRFPASERDLALVLDRQIPAGRVIDIIRDAAKSLLENVGVFDVYEGEHVAKGKKSLALRLRLRKLEGTLTEEEINEVIGKVVKKLDADLGASLRS